MRLPGGTRTLSIILYHLLAHFIKPNLQIIIQCRRTLVLPSHHMHARQPEPRVLLPMIKHQLSRTFLPFQPATIDVPVRPKATDPSPIPSSSSSPSLHAETPCTGAFHRGERRRPTSTPESPHDMPRRDLRDEGVSAPPLFFTGRRPGATRAYKWRGVSGRTRAPCGWLITRTRARHPPRHAPLPRARGPHRRRPFRRRHHRRRPPDRRRTSRPVMRTCDRPQSPPLRRRFAGRGRAVCSQRARCMQTAAG